MKYKSKMNIKNKRSYYHNMEKKKKKPLKLHQNQKFIQKKKKPKNLSPPKKKTQKFMFWLNSILGAILNVMLKWDRKIMWSYHLNYNFDNHNYIQYVSSFYDNNNNNNNITIVFIFSIYNKSESKDLSNDLIIITSSTMIYHII